MAACSPAGDDPGPGPVSSGEAEALEQAAEMLDEQRMPAEAEEEAAETVQDTPPDQ